jgi:hypothetical protein
LPFYIAQPKAGGQRRQVLASTSDLAGTRRAAGRRAARKDPPAF